MRKFLTAAVSTAILMVGTATAKAEPMTYKFDTVHSQIIFFVDHLGFAKSAGKFLDFDGHLIFDPENVESSSVEVAIDTASITLNDEPWDAHMKNEDFFDVDNYPTMTFKSTHIETTGENTGKITGDLTILETTRPVTLDVILNKAAPHPRSGKPYIGFSATTMLNRSDFGMNYGLPMVGDEVEIRLEIEAEGVTEENTSTED